MNTCTICVVNLITESLKLGALIACVGCYQLLKMNPSLFVDAVLGYAFYKLSVLSSQVRKQGFPNEYITRIKTSQFVISYILYREFTLRIYMHGPE